jgi:hypothetical protein
MTWSLLTMKSQSEKHSGGQPGPAAGVEPGVVPDHHAVSLGLRKEQKGLEFKLDLSWSLAASCSASYPTEAQETRVRIPPGCKVY